MKRTDQGQIRIIGGQWRSRILRFPAIEGLRPTPNRVRETLFNWLSPYIIGARCLDLFAGSGALGFEALSRGAKSVVMVDQSAEIVNYLHQQAELLAAKNITILQATFTKLTLPEPFDIVFLDPPFKQDLIAQCSQWLEEQHLLAANARIYIEAEAELTPLPVAKNWHILRSKIAGHVGYHLFTNTIM